MYVTIVCPGRVKPMFSFNALQGVGRPHAVMDDGQRKGISAGIRAAHGGEGHKNKNNEVLIGVQSWIPVYSTLLSATVLLFD
ncbi:MAG: hypothetical protein R2850_03210 [Bacteroidia bacterium]